MSNQAERVSIPCYGGCGRSMVLRRSKVQQADYYLCDSRQDRLRCEASLPPLMPGKVRRVERNAAGSFSGYRDEVPDAEMAASVMRARESLAVGLTQMAIEKAKACS